MKLSLNPLSMATPNPEKVIDKIVFEGPEDKEREAFI
jgi:hypothetical protein